MKIQKLHGLNSTKKNGYTTDPQYKVQINNVSFRANGDEFVKIVSDSSEVRIQALKKRFENLLQDANLKKDYSDIIEKTRAIQKRTKAMAFISEEYQIILDLLSNSSSGELSSDVEIIDEFLDASSRLDKGKGFHRVSGYDAIKKKLRIEFVLKTMMMARTSQKIDVPNAILVYGLPGNGKSLFSDALAEESLSNKSVVDAGALSEKEAMLKIVKHAKQAKQDYINSGDKKQRTIILVNEAEVLANPNSSVFQQFRDFIENCAEEYKCTLFLTSNHPIIFDKSILSKTITPLKIGIEPADKKDCKEIIDDMLTLIGRMPKGGTDDLVEAFYRNPDRCYSNDAIKKIISNTLRDFPHPTISDFLKVIERNDIRPTVSPRNLNDFYDIRKTLEG